MADEDTMSTEDLLEAFRRKKAEAAKQAGAAETADAPSAPDKDKGPVGEKDAGPVDDAPEAKAAPTDRPVPRGPTGPHATPPSTSDAATPESPPESQPEPEPAPPKKPEIPSVPEPQEEPEPDPEPTPEPAPEHSKEPEPASDPQPQVDPEPTPPSDPEPETEAEDDSAPESPEPSLAGQLPDPPLEAFRDARRPPQGLPTDDPVVDVAHRHRASDPTPVAMGARSLAPMDPSLGLTHRLERDPLVTRRKGGIYFRLAVGVVIFGLTVLAFDRLAFALQGNILLGDVRLTWIAIIIMALGVVAAPLLWVFLKERTVAVRFAASQEEEWERAADRVRLLGRLRWTGLGITVAGPLLVTIAAAVQGDERVLPLAYAGFTLLVVGAILAVVTHFMHRLSVRDYIQTTVLWILERTGLPHGAPPHDGSATGTTQGAPLQADPRVPQVLRSLDGLLAQLPDRAVDRFMQTPEAKAYLELMDSMPEA